VCSLRALLAVAGALLGVFAANCTQPFDPSLIQSAGGSGGSALDGAADAPEDAPGDACHGCWDLGCQPGDTAAACGTAGAQCTTCQSPTPVCFQGACVGEKVATSVAAGGETACLITIGNELHCWGSNSYGHTLAAPAGPTVTKATLVTAISSVASVAVNPQTNYPHACALTDAGALYCYGHNAYGQLGAGNVSNSADPLQVSGKWLEVAVGLRGTCASDVQKQIWCWGWLGIESNVPQLIVGDGEWWGLSAANERACAIKATEGDALYCWGTGLPMAPVAGASWKQVDVGWLHACGIRGEDQLSCWGDDTHGQLGGDLSGQWRSVSAGTTHTCGIQSDKSLWCWGSNEHGELGQGHDLPVVGPQKIGEPNTSWEAVAAGHEFNCAIDASRVVYCWGKNDFGQMTQPPHDPPEVHVPTPIQYAN
jgi:hypothetical protein